MSNFVWNNYQVMKNPIGHGKQGVIYKGYDTKNNRLVAIKKMRDIERAKREVTTMKIYGTHKYLPEFYDIFYNDNHAYIVMEWVEGRTLKQVNKIFNQQTAI